MSRRRWVQPPLFGVPDAPQPACRPCGDKGEVPRKRDGQPMACPWCDPSRKRS